MTAAVLGFQRWLVDAWCGVVGGADAERTVERAPFGSRSVPVKVRLSGFPWFAWVLARSSARVRTTVMSSPLAVAGPWLCVAGVADVDVLRLVHHPPRAC